MRHAVGDFGRIGLAVEGMGVEPSEQLAELDRDAGDPGDLGPHRVADRALHDLRPGDIARGKALGITEVALRHLEQLVVTHQHEVVQIDRSILAGHDAAVAVHDRAHQTPVLAEQLGPGEGSTGMHPAHRPPERGAGELGEHEGAGQLGGEPGGEQLDASDTTLVEHRPASRGGR